MRSAQLSPGSTRLIVELSASRVPRRAHSSNYQPDSSNYQPDSSNYQLKADNPANNPAVSFVVWAHAAAYTSKGRAFPETVPIEFIRALQGQSNRDNHRVCTAQDTMRSYLTCETKQCSESRRRTQYYILLHAVRRHIFILV